MGVLASLLLLGRCGLGFVLPAVHRASGAEYQFRSQNPRDNFCRRHGHQTVVIDDKLYIDGGFVNFDTFPSDHQTHSNAWLGFHDLRNYTLRNGEAWPNLDISLNKDPKTIPTVHGGVLWGDSVNKRFFVVGGEYTTGFPSSDFHLLSYDILYDKWDDFGQPALATPLTVSSYGAGVGVSEIGQGYYYGGWISNASMRGWEKGRTMSSAFYKYEYDTNATTRANAPDNLPRAEGAMLWIPAGDTGMLVYFGGVVSPNGTNDTAAPQPLDKIFVYDPSTNAWETQTATGEIPQNRRQFTAGVAWAPDRSSYNIYIWGGLSVQPPVVNVTAFSDIYILTIPSFTWLKVFPDRRGNATFKNGHYAASGNMVYGNSQMFIIGGTYPNPGDEDICDLAQAAWAQHNLFTGTKGNVGDHPNGTYWALPDPNITSNVVPVDVYNVVGGDKNGGATVLSPEAGYDTPNGLLHTLLTRQPTFAARTPTRPVTSTAPPPPDPPPPPRRLSTGAIVGIAIASATALVLISIAVCVMIGYRIRRRRLLQEQRRTSYLSEQTCVPGIIPSPQETGAPAVSEPYSSYFGLGSTSQHSVQQSMGGDPAQLEDTSPKVRPPPAELEAQGSGTPASQEGQAH
ncbi:hypothetical protein N657DRAFT_581594 [Parathielavia appendiculata]|uniref:Kelch repeat-containing protein n=1 Tax=Parathielavia appendiculata TaxID=2587402 RepID=A0AAN6YZ31_9PEZI|nr:hypothetical protein N657DRAFT_581594 [Parathielavia appendiculata]